MKIITYDELKDPYQFMKLMEPAFGWTPDPKRIAKIRRLDARYRHPFGFGLLAEGVTPYPKLIRNLKSKIQNPSRPGQNLVGFVGVMDVPVRTLSGETEIAGGLFAVATDPDSCRQGLATQLLEHAHAHFRKRGYRFSFLCTSRSLVAHSLYERLGYSDVASLMLVPRAYKLSPRKSKIQNPKSKILCRLDRRRIERIFQRETTDRTGFAVRIENWIRAYLDAKDMKPENSVVRNDGYAFFQLEGNTLWVYEFLASSRGTYERILGELEKKGKKVMVISLVYDPVLRDVLQERAFVFRTGRHFVLMSKPLANVTFDQAFGDRFYFTALDSF